MGASRSFVRFRTHEREDIDEAMGEGAGDEEEDGESEDGYEDGHGTAGAAKRSGTQRRKLRSFYTSELAQLLLQNWCSGQDNCRQRS